MTIEGYQVATTALGSSQGEMIKMLLESMGIPVILTQESVGQSSFPVTFGILGEVKVWVPEGQLDDAISILTDYEEGNLEDSSRSEEQDPNC